MLAGCALTPAERLDQQATEYGFQPVLASGRNFQHRVYWRFSELNQGVLHIYLAGDGRPWIRHRYIAPDPTPRRSLTLDLMSLDKAPSLYLGRPCYHGLSQTPDCTPYYWSFGRYSEAVIASMEAVLRKIITQTSYQQLVWIGYSGGGTIAMLLAPRFTETRAVITLAGNHDPDAWADWHSFSLLRGSMNPAHLPPLPASIIQMHFLGEEDDNIPLEVAQAALTNQTGAQLEIMSGFTHHCCWYSIWPSLLAKLPISLQ